jgi:HlyD family secretion protein
VNSPITGVVTTPRLSDLVGTYATKGTELAEVADLDHLRALIYVSEFEMYKFGPNSPARLWVDGQFGRHQAKTVAVSPLSSEIAPGLIDLSKYKGQRAPNFYVFDLLVDNPGGGMKPGMVGTARLYGRRHSLTALAVLSLWDFFGRKVW